MRVDAATHVWSLDARAWPWSPVDGVEVPQLGADVDQLIEDMDVAEVDWAVAVQPRSYGSDHRYLRHAVEQHPDRLLPIGLITSRSDALRQAQGLVQEWGMRGLRIVLVDDDEPSWIAEPASDPLFDWSVESGIPISFLVQDEHLHLVGNRANRTLSGTFIVDHLGLASRGAPKELLRLAANPNTYVKVSAFESLSEEAPPFPDLDELVRVTVGEFGAARCMWGSDYPYHSGVHTYRQSVAAARVLVGDTPASDQIFGKTAVEVFSLQAKER